VTTVINGLQQCKAQRRDDSIRPNSLNLAGNRDDHASLKGSIREDNI